MQLWGRKGQLKKPDPGCTCLDPVGPLGCTCKSEGFVYTVQAECDVERKTYYRGADSAEALRLAGQAKASGCWPYVTVWVEIEKGSDLDRACG